MTDTDVLPGADTAFGTRVRERLRDEKLIWLTAVGADGTPQPNPVWFLWDGADDVVVYTLADARRLAHIAARPRVSLNFNSDGGGGDIAVLRGIAERADDLPRADEVAAYLDKYADGMVAVVGSVEEFAATYSVPIRIRLTGARGF